MSYSSVLRSGGFVDKHVVEKGFHKGYWQRLTCTVGGQVSDVEELTIMPGWRCVRHRIDTDDLWLVVPLKDKAIVVRVPLDSQSNPLSPPNGSEVVIEK